MAKENGLITILEFIFKYPILIFVTPFAVLFLAVIIKSLLRENSSSSDATYFYSENCVSPTQGMSERNVVRYWFLYDLGRYMNSLYENVHRNCTDARERYQQCQKWLVSYTILQERIHSYQLAKHPTLPQEQHDEMAALCQQCEPAALCEEKELACAKDDLIVLMTTNPHGKRIDLINHFAYKSSNPSKYALYCKAVKLLAESRIVTIANTGQGYATYQFHSRIAKRTKPEVFYRINKNAPLYFNSQGVTSHAIYKALDTVSAPLNIDSSLGTAQFESLLSMNMYNTSLSHCTCTAYASNPSIPCKHMIRLAISLKVYSPTL